MGLSEGCHILNCVMRRHIYTTDIPFASKPQIVLLFIAHLLEKRSDAFVFDPNYSKNRDAVLTDLRWW